jgi:hypothetical protein
MQVKFEFGYGLLIFDLVIPLELWKKYSRNFQFMSIISAMVAHIIIQIWYMDIS